jgi:hypothetical protein
MILFYVSVRYLYASYLVNTYDSGIVMYFCTTVPTSIVHFFRGEIFPTVGGIYSILPGKNLVFCLCMIPTVVPLQKHGEEAEQRQPKCFRPAAAAVGSDDLPRRHLSSGVDALRTVAPSRPHRPSSPHGAASLRHHSRHETSIKTSRFFTLPPTFLSNPFLIILMRVRPDDVSGGGGGMHGEILHPRPCNCNQHLEGGQSILITILAISRTVKRKRGKRNVVVVGGGEGGGIE